MSGHADIDGNAPTKGSIVPANDRERDIMRPMSGHDNDAM
jgi:hypothetical protein